MTQNTSAFSLDNKNFNGVTLRTVLFLDQKDFEKSVDGAIDEKLLSDENGLVNIKDLRACTFGEYEDKNPVVTVMLCCIDAGSREEILAHEAGHAALAIVRHQVFNSMDSDLHVHIGNSISGNQEVTEEMLCIMIGRVNKELNRMLDLIHEHVRKEVFRGRIK